MIKKLSILIISIFISPSLLMADYPNTSIGVIDLNKILSDADAAIAAAEQIEKIAIEIESEIKVSDEEMIKGISESSKIINLNDLPSALTLHITIILIFEIFDEGNRFGGYCKMIQKVLDEDKDDFVQKIKQSKK